jgi:hypothetical protein
MFVYLKSLFKKEKLMMNDSSNSITVIRSEKLSKIGIVNHFFSTRKGGVSSGVFSSLNFGSQHGEASNMVRNIDLLNGAIAGGSSRFVIPKQTHSDVVAVVDADNLDNCFDSTDALITNLPNVFVCVKTADCVPILLFDPVLRVVAAVHSGWRGTAQNIVGKSIVLMGKTFGCSPSDIIAAIGPCIGKMNYEVGREVVEAMSLVLDNSSESITAQQGKNDKFCLDLVQANVQLLCQAGINPDNIDYFSFCTFSEPELFYSARRDGSKTGRMLSGIMIK